MTSKHAQELRDQIADLFEHGLSYTEIAQHMSLHAEDYIAVIHELMLTLDIEEALDAASRRPVGADDSL